MRVLTPQQKARIAQIINDNHLAFLADAFGASAIPAADYDRLVSAGKIHGQVFQNDPAVMSHVLGQQSVGTTPAVLAPAEREAVAVARDRFATRVAGLGNKLVERAGNYIIEADDDLRRQRLLAMQRVGAAGIAARQQTDEIARRMRDATGDAHRNMLQIANTEVHNTMEDGRVCALLKAHPPGTDIAVFKRPRPDACAYCNLLYLRPGTKIPRVFRLSELSANGTNIDRRAGRPTLKGPTATEYRPVVGATHPWCACTLFEMPVGHDFAEDGTLLYVGDVRKSFIIEDAPRYVDHICG